MRRTVNFKRTFLFAAATILLIAISAFCITGTVLSQSKNGGKEMENYYRVQEKNLLNQTKEQLTGLGFSNSGVTLTRVVDEEGNREYTFTIHHKKIDKMTEQEREILVAQLACDTELAENCSFYHEFLVTVQP